MKHLYSPPFVIILCTILFFHTVQSQNVITCPSDYNYRLPGASDPQQQLRIKKELQKIKEYAAKNQSRSIADTLKIIPVVVHVLHDNWKGVLSKAQIIAGLNAMNTDLRKLNSDTNNIRSFYKPLLSDLKVEMRLAQIDPDGNCTDGIQYINTVLTYNASDTCKSVAGWPPNKYFNFWIVTSIDPSPWGLSGIIAGYEKFPWFGINNKYGAVVRSEFWNAPGRTLTHEIGHCLGLWHMWQDQSLNNWGDGCSFIVGHDCTDNDDMVCDTPPMYQPNSGCNLKANSCSNDSIGPSPYPRDTLDMVENFMSYSTCKYMFTTGQKSRVSAVFGTYPELQNLVSNANLIATGTNNGYVSQMCAPKADFSSTKTMVCKNTSIAFSDASKRGTATSWKWSFPGGSPSISTLQNPTIYYTTPGSYDVKLVVSNSTGKDSITYKKHVIVSENTAKYNDVNYYEGFEDSTSFANDWQTPATSGKAIWKRIKGTAFEGNNCIMINNIADAWSGETIELISPSYSLSSFSMPELIFRTAYARYDSTISEFLRIYISTDCGTNWTLRGSRGSSVLKSAPDQKTPYTPISSTEWRPDRISLASFVGNTNIRFKFEFTSGKGNNIYLDDFHIRQIVGIEENNALDGEVNIYPNPTNNEAAINFTTNKNINNVNISVYDVLGKKTVEVINTDKLLSGTHNYKINLNNHFAPGIYFIKMTSESAQWTKKLIVE